MTLLQQASSVDPGVLSTHVAPLHVPASSKIGGNSAPSAILTPSNTLITKNTRLPPVLPRHDCKLADNNPIQKPMIQMMSDPMLIVGGETGRVATRRCVMQKFPRSQEVTQKDVYVKSSNIFALIDNMHL